MTFPRLAIHPAAADEAAAAMQWYHERSPRAAENFDRELNQVIDTILAAPRRWPLGPYGTRKV